MPGKNKREVRIADIVGVIASAYEVCPGGRGRGGTRGAARAGREHGFGEESVRQWCKGMSRAAAMARAALFIQDEAVQQELMGAKVRKVMRGMDAVAEAKLVVALRQRKAEGDEVSGRAALALRSTWGWTWLGWETSHPWTSQPGDVAGVGSCRHGGGALRHGGSSLTRKPRLVTWEETQPERLLSLAFASRPRWSRQEGGLQLSSSSLL